MATSKEEEQRDVGAEREDVVRAARRLVELVVAVGHGEGLDHQAQHREDDGREEMAYRALSVRIRFGS